MAKVTNALATYDLATNREDLADFVSNIDPYDTKFMSAIGETEAASVKHEWSIDSLAAASSSNAKLEGYEVSRESSDVPDRTINYCQISGKNATVTRTQMASNPAGIADMMEYQLLKKGRELKRDMETILTGNQGYNAGNSTLARRLRSLESWLTTNTDFDATSTGTDGADSTGGNSARTDSDEQRFLTEAILERTHEDVWTSGGNPTILMVNGYNNSRVADFTGRSAHRVQVDPERIQAAASVYVGVHGTLKVLPNRFQRGRSAFLIDPEMVKVAYMPGRKFATYPLGIIGSAITEVMESEYTLQMTNEKAHGGIFDLAATSTQSTT